MYDAVSGREVAHQRGITVETDHKGEDLQTVNVEAYADSRLMDDEALETASKRLGEWHVDSNGPMPEPNSGHHPKMQEVDTRTNDEETA